MEPAIARKRWRRFGEVENVDKTNGFRLDIVKRTIGIILQLLRYFFDATSASFYDWHGIGLASHLCFFGIIIVLDVYQFSIINHIYKLMLYAIVRQKLQKITKDTKHVQMEGCKNQGVAFQTA